MIREEEREPLVLLRERMETYKTEHPDFDFTEYDALAERDVLRFLRARNYNIEIAAKLLFDTLQWRLAFGCQSIEPQDISEELVKNKFTIGGYDLEMRPCIFGQVRYHFGSDSNPEIMQRMIVWLLEEGRKKVVDENPYCNIIVDLKGFGLSNMDYGLVKYLLEIFRDYYPDTLGIMLIVNSPFIFKGCWKIIRPWLDPITAEKIKFIKQAELNRYVPEDIIPTFLGGPAEKKLYTEENIADGSHYQFWEF
eukprot:TRINITY_DN12202_c0_g1_i1.p1 TRINITY_DN12202_c0_g1~~TRINITY_DN12202_c0_g1_i1.p1  ORF type:complete len:251 (+),score=56.09 TRINITY_DN12202_c0_g1_i1:211-963(+)